MFKLYELSEGIERINAMLEDGVDGLQDTLDALDGAFEEKVEGIIKLARSKAATREVIKAEIDRLTKTADKLSKDAEWLESYVEREMIRANKMEVKSALFGIQLKMSPPRVEVSDAAAIPTEYLRVVPATTAPDKKAIKEAIQGGKSVPGCSIAQDMKLKVK